jgi:stage II sporulation protein M
MRAVVQNYWDLIRGAKKWLAVTGGLFCFAFAAAIVVGLAKPSLIQEMIDQLPSGNETGFSDFIAIARNNVTVMLISWCGSLVLAIGPLWNTLHMGFIGGGLLTVGPLTFWFVSIIPHGIIELPAMLLSNAFFLKFGLRWAFQKGGIARKRAWVADLGDSLKIALLCAVLFCVAATVEAFATPKILDAYVKKHFAGIGVEAQQPGGLTESSRGSKRSEDPR